MDVYTSILDIYRYIQIYTKNNKMEKELRNNRLNNFDGRYIKTSINIRTHEANFLKQSGFSVTAIFRKALNDLMNNKQHEDIKEMYSKIERLSKLIQQQAQFIENKGLSSGFGSFQEKSEEDELKRRKSKDLEEEEDEIFKAHPIKSKEDK